MPAWLLRTWRPRSTFLAKHGVEVGKHIRHLIHILFLLQLLLGTLHLHCLSGSNFLRHGDLAPSVVFFAFPRFQLYVSVFFPSRCDFILWMKSGKKLERNKPRVSVTFTMSPDCKAWPSCISPPSFASMSAFGMPLACLRWLEMTETEKWSGNNKAKPKGPETA